MFSCSPPLDVFGPLTQSLDPSSLDKVLSFPPISERKRAPSIKPCGRTRLNVLHPVFGLVSRKKVEHNICLDRNESGGQILGMETTVPVSYSYPTHDLRALEPRRYLSSHHEPEVPLWSSSPVGFAPPLASSYGAGHAIHGYSHTYQQFLGGSSGAPPIQPLRQPTSSTMLPLG